MVRDIRDEDVDAVCGIYNHYILHTFVTFEEETLAPVQMAERVRGIKGRNLPWLVCEEEGEILGYAYAGPWHVRAAYRYSVESSVYLAHTAVGGGRGRQLYEVLLERLKAAGVHTVIGGVALPNPASVALHEKLGFVKASHYKEVGWKMDRWIDVAYWQLIF